MNINKFKIVIILLNLLLLPVISFADDKNSTSESTKNSQPDDSVDSKDNMNSQPDKKDSTESSASTSASFTKDDNIAKGKGSTD